ncbi:MAG: hypothetical protein QNJ81_01770 [Acidimicrobiia bacterium]|nr:hypothetical protein [Acidimicrobiia bacterium]
MRRLLTLLTVITALTMVMVAPASAGPQHHPHHPLGGEQVMVLNEKPDGTLGQYGCEEISWFGTIELYGRTYGMALYPIDGYLGDDGLYHYEESWRIFRNTFKLRDGFLKRCEPGKVLAAGEDAGTWSLDTGEFESYGVVEFATWRFRHWQGHTVRQQGITEPIDFGDLEDVFGFYGTFELL